MEDDKVDLLHRDPNSINQHVQVIIADRPEMKWKKVIIGMYITNCYHASRYKL